MIEFRISNAIYVNIVIHFLKGRKDFGNMNSEEKEIFDNSELVRSELILKNKNTSFKNGKNLENDLQKKKKNQIREDQISKSSKLRLFFRDLFGLSGMNALITPKVVTAGRKYSRDYINMVRLFVPNDLPKYLKEITDADCQDVIRISNSYNLNTTIENYLFPNENKSSNYSSYCKMSKKRSDEFKTEIENDRTGKAGFIFDMFVSELYNHGYRSKNKYNSTLKALNFEEADIKRNSLLTIGLENACKYVKKYSEYDFFMEKVRKFEKQIEFSKTSCNVDLDGLHKYLELIVNCIFPNEYKNFYFAKEIYNFYLENHQYYKLLANIFLSIATCQEFDEPKKSYSYNPDSYNPNSHSLKNNAYSDNDYYLLMIWYDKDVVLKLMKGKDSKAIIELYESIPKLLLREKDIKFWFDYIVCLRNAGDYLSYFSQLKKEAGCEYDDFGKETFVGKSDYADAAYELYECYLGKYSNHGIDKDTEKAKIYKKRAIELGCCDLVFEEIKVLYDSSQENYDSIDELLSYIDKRKKRESAKLEQLMGDSQLPLYYFYKAFCYEKKDVNKDAQDYYKKALDLGYEPARQKLNKESRHTVEYQKNFKSELGENICIINSPNDNTKVLLRTLSDNFTVYSVNCDFKKAGIAIAENFNNVKECIDKTLASAEKLTNKKIIIALLADDDTENLSQGLEILDRLFNYALDITTDDELNKFIDKIDIYIKCNYDYASTFIDASISDMGDKIYFATHIVDPYRNSLHELLYDKPLFLLCLNGESGANVTICGTDNNFNLSVIKEIMAVGYIGKAHPVNISIYSENYTELKEMVEINLPGLDKPKPGAIKGIIHPNIIETDFSKLQLLKQLDSDEKINYIIVNVGSDAENIAFAVKLRRYLLVNSDKLDRKPFIAVYCKDPKTAFLANRMTLGNKAKEGSYYYNNYELYFFGMTEDIYTYDKLINNNLEKQALAIHLSYSGLSLDSEHNERTHDAFNSYYSFQYNQDSSKNAAICLRYRLYIAGCYSEPKIIFSLEDDSTKYADEYENRLNKVYSEVEQIRWNNFMISRGWCAPTIEQLKEYLEKPEIANHQYLLAKLHPYIANWDDLNDDGEICKTIKEHKKIKFKSPQESTRNGVAETAGFLRMLGKTKEKEADIGIER